MKERFLFIPNRRFWLVLSIALFALGLFMVSAVAAQEATPEPLPPIGGGSGTSVIPPDVVSVESGGQMLLAAILAIAATFVGSPLTTALVNILKVFVPDAEHGGLSAEALRNMIAVGLWVIYSVLAHFNLQSSFESIGNLLVLLLAGVTPFLTTLLGSSIVHEAAVKHNIPILSYQRE